MKKIIVLLVLLLIVINVAAQPTEEGTGDDEEETLSDDQLQDFTGISSQGVQAIKSGNTITITRGSVDLSNMNTGSYTVILNSDATYGSTQIKSGPGISISGTTLTNTAGGTPLPLSAIGQASSVEAVSGDGGGFTITGGNAQNQQNPITVKGGGPGSTVEGYDAQHNQVKMSNDLILQADTETTFTTDATGNTVVVSSSDSSETITIVGPMQQTYIRSGDDQGNLGVELYYGGAVGTEGRYTIDDHEIRLPNDRGITPRATYVKENDNDYNLQVYSIGDDSDIRTSSNSHLLLADDSESIQVITLGDTTRLLGPVRVVDENSVEIRMETTQQPVLILDATTGKTYTDMNGAADLTFPRTHGMLAGVHATGQASYTWVDGQGLVRAEEGTDLRIQQLGVQQPQTILTQSHSSDPITLTFGSSPTGLSDGTQVYLNTVPRNDGPIISIQPITGNMGDGVYSIQIAEGQQVFDFNDPLGSMLIGSGVDPTLAGLMGFGGYSASEQFLAYTEPYGPVIQLGPVETPQQVATNTPPQPDPEAPAVSHRPSRSFDVAVGTYDVKSGDTLSHIAQDLSMQTGQTVTWQDLVRMNPNIQERSDRGGDLIFAGEQIFINPGTATEVRQYSAGAGGRIQMSTISTSQMQAINERQREEIRHTTTFDIGNLDLLDTEPTFVTDAHHSEEFLADFEPFQDCGSSSLFCAIGDRSPSSLFRSDALAENLQLGFETTIVDEPLRLRDVSDSIDEYFAEMRQQRADPFAPELIWDQSLWESQWQSQYDFGDDFEQRLDDAMGPMFSYDEPTITNKGLVGDKSIRNAEQRLNTHFSIGDCDFCSADANQFVHDKLEEKYGVTTPVSRGFYVYGVSSEQSNQIMQNMRDWYQEYYRNRVLTGYPYSFLQLRPPTPPPPPEYVDSYPYPPGNGGTA
ncbi:LysM peptidoglycan-binding domain-containing protein [Candidatus Woesearchaeota archaeon]|nr:LysM peptidoglycan-binding domain-containing protein [Candidatus Woesearchaeota archaeon]